MTISTEKRVLTPVEVAEILRVEVGLVYRQLQANKIPSIKLGDRWIIPARRFDEWLNEGGVTIDEKVTRN